MLKLTPTSVRKLSKFLPLRFFFAASRTLASIAQQASQGSVFTNDSSSFRGLNSVFFCFASCADSHATIAAQIIIVSAISQSNCRGILTVQQAVHECISRPFNPADRLTIEDHHLTTHSNRSTGQREKRCANILLP